MSAVRALRVAVAGATGALGEELLAALGERRFPVDELVAWAGPESEGEEVDFRGESWTVLREPESLRALDLIFLCAPRAVSLELSRRALRDAVPCIDLSGGLAEHSEVPLLAADLAPTAKELAAPLLVAAGGPALASALVLAALEREAGVRRVVATLLESAVGAGRRGIESLTSESVALFNQHDLPDPTVFPASLAFDCHALVGETDADGVTDHERRVASDWRRLAAPDAVVAVSALRVPTFSGDAAVLAVETARPLDPAAAAEALGKLSSLVVWGPSGPTPTTRAVSGSEVAVVARVRRDPSCAQGLLLWVASDTLRLTALNAVRLAEARLRAAAGGPGA